MNWLGLDWDEGPFYQTKRYPLYEEKVQKLLSEGKAYPCVCTPEKLEAKRQLAQKEKRKSMYDGTCRPPEGVIPPLPQDKPYTIRFRSPRDGSTIVNDAVKGDVVFDNRELDDLIIARSDGTPTYNFCVVVDDIDMGITHVLRGDDHLANTPRQILLYQALGAPLPTFGHVPLILGPDKARLSKRHGAMAVTAYRDMGFLPDAVCNYLARLGWSHGDEEIFSREELIAKFDLESIGKSAAVFDLEKMQWVNTVYLRALPPAELAAAALPFIAQAGLPVPGDDAWLAKALATVQELVKTFVELVEHARIYLVDQVAIDPAAPAKFLPPAIPPPP